MARLLGPAVLSQLPSSSRCSWLLACSPQGIRHAASTPAPGSSIIPDEPVGPGGGGDSQQRAQEMKRRLDPYQPQHEEGVTIVHKHGMALLWDPWYNKGE